MRYFGLVFVFLVFSLCLAFSAKGAEKEFRNPSLRRGQERKDSFCKGSGGKIPPPTISLDEVAKILAENPPETHLGFQRDIMNTKRAWAMMEIDCHVYQHGPLDENLTAYYRHQVDKALDEIENTPAPETGVLFWKMYSSGVIFKSKDGIFSIDLVEGPVQRNDKTAEEVNAIEPRVIEGKRRILQVRLYWTPEQRDRLVKLLDVYFVTHRHYDHVSFTLTRALLAAGKTVVAPRDVKDLYLNVKMPGAEKIIVPEYSDGRETKVNTYHGMETVVFFGYQDGYRPITKNGYPGLEFNPSAPQNNVYIFKTGGRKIMADGDIRNYDAEFLPWLISLVNTEWEPDTSLLVAYFRNAKRTMKILFNPFIIPLHELEMGHFRELINEPAPRPLFYLRPYRRLLDGYKNDMASKKATVISWGEKLYLPPATEGKGTD